MTTKTMDVSLPFVLKQEQDEPIIDDTDDDISLEDINNLLSMQLPSLSANKLHIPIDSNDEFLRLTTMVRAVYFSYLHKCLLTNYILCYKEKHEDVPCSQLKKCADQMELNAVRSALEATLYRQNMLKLISDVKSHTSEKKAYKKLVIFLESPSDKVDVGVQTSPWTELQRTDNIQSVCITSNCEELAVKQASPSNNEENIESIREIQDTFTHSNYHEAASPTVNSTSFHEAEQKFNDASDDDINNKMIVEEEIMKEESSTSTDLQNNHDTQTIYNESCIKNDDENSQDSLLQHMEDMFCESDDSTDLTTLIEKHSGVTKANIDQEINKMSLETDSSFPCNSNLNISQKGNNTVKSNSTRSINAKPSNPGRYSFSYYKEMKNREANKQVLSEQLETVENKQKRRANSIWFVERVHQVSKLKGIMTELSLRNYRKHGRVKEKFVELFGESDDEEMMPDSPICIEEHLTACKERIAPWIVEHLMPFYKKKRIKDRQLFKMVAKHIADMLILENTFPEQDCVSKYVEIYFKNKKFIKTTQDIYL